MTDIEVVREALWSELHRLRAENARLKEALTHIKKHDDGTWPLSGEGVCSFGPTPGAIAAAALKETSSPGGSIPPETETTDG